VHVFWSFLLSVVVCVSACSDDLQQTSAGSSPASLAAPTTQLKPSAAFCDLATRATKGEVTIRDPNQTAKLTESPDLTENQRSRMRGAIEDAKTQLAGGAGYSNDLLVAAVNEICGLKLTPVTMVE
jgi:hypothetical protein